MTEQGLYNYTSNEIINIMYNYINTFCDFTNTSLLCIVSFFSYTLSLFYGNTYLVELYIAFSIINFILLTVLDIKENDFSLKKSFKWVIKLFTGLCTIYLLGVLLHAITLVTSFGISTTIINVVLNMIVLLLMFTEASSCLDIGVLLGLPIPIIVIYVIDKLNNRINSKLEHTINYIEGNDDK